LFFPFLKNIPVLNTQSAILASALCDEGVPCPATLKGPGCSLPIRTTNPPMIASPLSTHAQLD
jgi:hypothetical protein